MLILLLATTYTLMADSSDDIKAAINQTVEHMSFITRPIARGRLNKTNPLPQHVQVTETNDTISVAFDNGNPIVTPLDGDVVPWRSSMTNEDYKAHVERHADTTAQVIVAPDGQRTNAYVFTDHGARLELRVTISSHRLPRPLTYTLRFRRDS
ncbi:MAG TPA: hypothetical protein VFA43_06065 [Gemmatimonadaceae bacterium]|nr:hypothetical protein [Gemmatimonadaceae bacterium]